MPPVTHSRLPVILVGCVLGEGVEGGKVRASSSSWRRSLLYVMWLGAWATSPLVEVKSCDAAGARELCVVVVGTGGPCKARCLLGIVVM